MDHISKMLPSVTGRYNLKSESESSLILKKLSNQIEKIWGEKGSQNLQPQKIVFNQVFIKATNSAWAQEIHLKKIELLDFLNQLKLKKILNLKIIL